MLVRNALGGEKVRASLTTNTCAELDGPPDSPYEGGFFRLVVAIPDRYVVLPSRRTLGPNQQVLVQVSFRTSERSFRDAHFPSKH